MARSIAIVGAGQAGLQLAIGLLINNYKVTLVTERLSQEILDGKIMSSQGMFNLALQHERDLGIDFWSHSAPQNTSVTFTIAKPQSTEIGIQWKGLVDKPFQSVDQRLKFSSWLDKFSDLGGNIIHDSATLKMLDELTDSNDLTLIATGKGELSKLFKLNDVYSIYHSPPRV